MDYEHWSALSNEDLEKKDIAEVSLTCAVGLPGSEGLDISACLPKLDQWAEKIREGTSRALRNRAHFPEYDELSESEYRILTMYSALYRHLGLTPHVEIIKGRYDGSDSRNQFMHAVLADGYPATCCAAPVIFAALGRRLGYPLKLVKTREHIFCRWVSAGGERFNIEATDMGYYRKSDAHYLTWPKPIYRKALEVGIFLGDLTPREELGLFLSLRGIVRLWNLQVVDAIDALYYACQVDPREYFYRKCWIMATMFAHARRDAASRRGSVDCHPSLWRVPARCESWDPNIYQSACDVLAQIQEKFVNAPRASDSIDVRDLVFQEIASR